MKKSVLFVLIGVIILLIAAIILLQVFDINLLKKDEVVIEITPTPQPTADPIQEILKLEFDDIEDAEWFRYWEENTIENGQFILNHETGLKYFLEDNMLIHLRVKQNTTKGTMYSGYMIDISRPDRMNEGARFYLPCTETPNIELHTDEWFTGFWLRGTALLSGDKWLDVVIHYSKEDATLSTVVADAENNDKIVYNSVKLPEEWLTDTVEISMFSEAVDENWMSVDNAEVAHIDWLGIYEGDFEQYIKSNVAAYRSNADMMDRYFSIEPVVLEDSKHTYFDESHGDENEQNDDNQDSNIFGEGYIDSLEYNYSLDTDAGEYEILSKYFEGINLINDGTLDSVRFDFDCIGASYELANNGEHDYYAFTTGDNTGDVSLWRGMTIGQVTPGNSGNVAFYTEFKADKYQNHKFIFSGAEDIYLYFNRDGMYIEYLHTYFSCLTAPLTPHNSVTGFDLVDGSTYCMAAAFDDQGVFRIILWEKGNYYNRTYQSCDMSGRTKITDTSDWKLSFRMQENNTFELYETITLAFEEYTDLESDMQAEIVSTPEENYGLEKGAALSEIMDVYLTNVEIKQEGFDFLDISTYDGADVKQKNNGQSDYCVYTSGKGEGYFRTKTSIKEYCGGEKEQQGVYIEFDPKDAKYTHFEFQSDNEEDRCFIKFRDNVPYLFNYHTDERVYYETFNSQYMHLHHGVTYCMLVTFDENGQFNSVIWEKDNFYNRAECSCNLDKIANWHYCATLVFNNRMDVYDIKMFSFDGFQLN